MNPDGASGPLFWSVPKVGSSIGLVCVVSGAAMVHVGRSVSNGQDETGKRKWFLYYGLRAFFFRSFILGFLSIGGQTKL